MTVKAPLWSRPARSRCARRSSATACSPTSRRSARPCSPTRAARASASGSATTSRPARPNTIVTSFNRNFPARNDGNADTLAFIGSPEIVVGDGAHRAPRRRLRAAFRPTARGARAARPPTTCRREGFDPGDVRVPSRRPTDPSTVDGRRSRRTPSGSSCSRRSRRGTATTSPGCGCC